MLHSLVQRIWYGGSKLAVPLLPFSGVFACLAALRRALYRVGVYRVARVGKPVIVIGNISVGGTGKTPLVIWLADALRSRGFKPGIITRGYRGNATRWPCDVTRNSDPHTVGDEAVLLAIRTGDIVVAGPDRAQAARRAVECGATIILCDDGLQHYRLARDYEIAVVDAARLFGNGYRLPAGPLRESRRRLQTVDAVVFNERVAQSNSSHTVGCRLEIAMHTQLGAARSLLSGAQRELREFAGETVRAIAGIGNPDAFFQALRFHGLEVAGRSLPDHARMVATDLQFPDRAPILMTEKDAVKARLFADERCWVVPQETSLDDAERLMTDMLRKLDTAH